MTIFPQQRKLTGSSALFGVHWCRRWVGFSGVQEKVPEKVPEARSGSTGLQEGSGEGSGEGSRKPWMQSQVKFNGLRGRLQKPSQVRVI